MNIKISPESVRIRVSLDEARVLERRRILTQVIGFVEGELSIEVSIVPGQNEAAQFRFMGWRAQVVLRAQDFFELMEDKPSRQSCITVPLKSAGGPPLEFVFEIDLFSRKQQKESRK